MEGVLALIFVGGLVAGAVVMHRRAKAKQNDRLAAVAALLGGGYELGEARAWGKAFGPRLDVRYATRGSGSSSESWTEVDVELPRGYALAMLLRRHKRSDHRQIARGDMVDVEVGDPAFDTAFLVEAAPAEVARGVLDAPFRTFLAGFDPVELTDATDGDRRVLRWATREWIEDTARIRAVLEQMARVGTLVREAYAAADAAIAPTEVGAPYRPALDDQPAKDAGAARDQEVAAVTALRAVRARRIQMAGRIVVGVLVLAMVAVASAAKNGC